MTLSKVNSTIDQFGGLADKLEGYWAKGTWLLRELPIHGLPEDNGLSELHRNSTIQFDSLLPNHSHIRAEMKYGCMVALQCGNWTPTGLAQGGKTVLSHFPKILTAVPTISSILDNTWDEWERILTVWYTKNYPKRFKTRKIIVKDHKDGFKETLMKEGVEPIGRFKKIYEIVRSSFSTDNTEEWEKDIVNLEVLGYRKKKSDPVTLNFTYLSPQWLKVHIRSFIKEQLIRGNLVACSAEFYLSCLRSLGRFIEENEPHILKPEHIDRVFIRRFINYVNTLITIRVSSKQQAGEPVSSRTKDTILRAARVFIRESGRMGIAPYAKQDLFDSSDFPEKIHDESIKHIPDFVADQIDEHLDKLPEPWHSIMAINLDVGARIGDSVLIPLDCLIYDDDDNPYLVFESQKTNAELYPLPIKPETHEIIKAAQTRALDFVGSDCNILFPANKRGESYSPSSIDQQLRKWIMAFNIKDEDGRYWQISTHQCRHTVGMNILNNGGTEADVQYMLKQMSAGPGRKYSRLKDETRKLEWAKYKGLVIDCTGTVVDDLESVNSIESQWLKHNLHTQVLPNGYCKKPVTDGECEHANRCLRCKAFRTCKTFLPVHKKHLAKSNNIAQNARAEGRIREAQTNETMAGILSLLIARLERLNKGETADAAI